MILKWYTFIEIVKPEDDRILIWVEILHPTQIEALKCHDAK
jgi:hypothetical protein